MWAPCWVEQCPQAATGIRNRNREENGRKEKRNGAERGGRKNNNRK